MQKNLTAMLNGLVSTGQVNVARVLEISEPTVSRMKDDELPRVAKLLATCELKVVPETWRCVDPRQMDALLVLAGGELDRLRARPDLVWEDEA